MTEKRTPVKVGLTAEENAHITRQAQALGMDRSTLMRLRALGDPCVPAEGVQPSAPPLSLRQYQNAVTAALRASSGSCSRPVVEAITAAVLCSIHAIPNKSADPVPSQTLG
jgi:hypothetical protein